MSASPEAEEAPAVRDQPLDLVNLTLDLIVFVKLRGDRELVGKLHGFDGHCNLVLGDVTETIYEPNQDDEEEEEGGRRTMEKKSEMLFVRGDSVVMIAAVK